MLPVALKSRSDTLDGVRNAIVVAGEMRERGHRLHGVRLDSGDLAALALKTRRMLDEAGYEDTSIFASGGLNEWKIHELVRQQAPIDAYGVGTDLVTSLDRAAVDIAYKLVAYDGRPVTKLSEGKSLLPGPKQVFRTDGPDSDVLATHNESLAGTPLLSLLWDDGDRKRAFDIATAREHVTKELARLPERWRLPPYPDQPPGPAISADLLSLAAELGDGRR
jgi:nicotinate phosphoribosyltransferase